MDMKIWKLIWKYVSSWWILYMYKSLENFLNIVKNLIQEYQSQLV